MLNNLQRMPLILFQKRVFQKAAEATGDLIGNKIADKTKTASKTAPKE